MDSQEGQRMAAQAKKESRVKVMVTLRGFDATRLSEGGEAGGYAEKRALYAARKEHAKEARDGVVTWLKTKLKESKEKGETTGSVRRASEPTVFGTFTLEVTPSLIALLKRAPGVASVMPVEDASLTLLKTSG